MSAGSFSGDQIRQFRRIYNEFSDPSEGGVLLEAFAPAVEACLHAVGLPLPPSSDYFDHEFRRLSTAGTVTWQKFFQVLIHINVNESQGTSCSEEVFPLPPIPPREPAVSSSSPPPFPPSSPPLPPPAQVVAATPTSLVPSPLPFRTSSTALLPSPSPNSSQPLPSPPPPLPLPPSEASGFAQSSIAALLSSPSPDSSLPLPPPSSASPSLPPPSLPARPSSHLLLSPSPSHTSTTLLPSPSPDFSRPPTPPPPPSASPSRSPFSASASRSPPSAFASRSPPSASASHSPPSPQTHSSSHFSSRPSSSSHPSSRGMPQPPPPPLPPTEVSVFTPSRIEERQVDAPSVNSPVTVPTSSGSGRSRVEFVDTPSVTYLVEPQHQAGNPPPNSWSHTLRSQSTRFGRAVGNFFGVTEESLHGTSDQMGWGRFGEISAGETFGPIRRPSFIGFRLDESLPNYPGVAPALVEVGAHSFDPAELGDSSDEENDSTFITPAPPSYEYVTSGPSDQSTDQSTSHAVADDELIGDEDRSAPVRTVLPMTTIPAHATITTQQYPSATRPPVQREQRRQREPEQGPFIHNKTVAWDYYLKFIRAERRLRQRRHYNDAVEFFGSADASETITHQEEPGAVRRGSIRRDRLSSTEAQLPQAQHRRKRKKATKLQRQSTHIRHKVESLPSFTPWFIIVISIMQVVALIILLSFRGVTTIRAIPTRHTGVFPSLSENTSNARVTYYRSVNLWIGLSPLELIEIGAKFTPCMRRDFGIQRRNTQLYGDRAPSIACCKNQDNVGSVLSLSECACSLIMNACSETQINITGVGYRPGSTCSANFSESLIGLPNFHPCCVSITGICLVTSPKECNARGGFYHPDLDNCLEVNCLEDICGFNGVYVGIDNDTPYLPTANQFWRWFLSIFIHLGVIHIIIVMPIQLYIGIKIERTIGWLRVGLIYLISGVGGNILSAIFVPYGVNAGASGAVLGLIGVLFVELFQFWQIVDRALLELVKLITFVVFLLAVGTLPYVDNMAHIGGLLFGVVAAVVFVPYITFGKLDTARKRILLSICAPFLFFLFIAGLLTFYLIPDSSFCEGCGYINCVPYAPDLCPDEYRNPEPDIFSL